MAVGLGPIGQIHISVTDIDRSVAFYRDTLGLPFLFQVSGQPMAFFDAGGTRLYLGVPEDPAYTSHPVLYFTTDDIDRTHGELTERGVEFIDDPHVVHREGEMATWMTFFVDPDGTHLALMSERHSN
jgi:predicted enzyme related to lactoylglutathione lyase